MARNDRLGVVLSCVDPLEGGSGVPPPGGPSHAREVECASEEEGRRILAKYLVEKLLRGELRVLNYARDREDGEIVLFEPGRDLICVQDAGSEETAKAQAEAYWNGTHQSPEQINAWVEWARRRKAELPPPSTR